MVERGCQVMKFSIDTVIKAAEHIQEFQMLLTAWDEKPCIFRNCISCYTVCM